MVPANWGSLILSELSPRENSREHFLSAGPPGMLGITFSGSRRLGMSTTHNLLTLPVLENYNPGITPFGTRQPDYRPQPRAKHSYMNGYPI